MQLLEVWTTHFQSLAQSQALSNPSLPEEVRNSVSRENWPSGFFCSALLNSSQIARASPSNNVGTRLHSFSSVIPLVRRATNFEMCEQFLYRRHYLQMSQFW